MGQKKGKFFKKTCKKNRLLFFLIIIFLFNFVFKIFKIESIPPGSTYDEMVYVTESQIILKYGTDASGQWRPWSLSPSTESFSELTSTTLIPGFVIFPNNPILASKIIPVLMGSLLPIFLALIVYYFAKKEIYLFSTALVATFNPWIFQFSRMGFDSLFSIFFYLFGIVLLLYLKKWWKMLASLAFFWGFFQYQGHKVILLPLIFLFYLILFIEELSLKNKNKFKTVFFETLPVLFLLVFAIFLTSNYLLRLKTLKSSSRVTEFSLIDQSELSDIVVEKRKLAFDSPLAKIYDNKLTVYFSIVYKRFLESFDPLLLFFRGDKKIDTFAVTDYGFFHFTDLLLICLCLILISQGFKKFSLFIFFIISFIILGTIPNLIKNQDTWITFRGSFVFLGLIMMSGLGLGLVIDLLKNKNHRLYLIILYFLTISPFFYIYFFRYPITQTLHRGFYQRVLANYIKRANNKNFILVTDLSEASYDYLLTYNQYIKTEAESSINNSANESEKIINNGQVKIFETCPENLNDLVNENTVLIVDWTKEPCIMENNLINKSEIVSLVDSGTHYSISNDQLCSKFVLQPFINLKQNFLAIEKLDLETFCTTFLVRR